MRCESTEVTDVVVSLGDSNVKTGIARDAELLAGLGADPVVAVLEFVFTRAAHALHDFGGARIESEGRGEHYTDRFFGAIRQNDVVADAFAVKVDVGLGGNGNVVEFFGGHVEI